MLTFLYTGVYMPWWLCAILALFLVGISIIAVAAYGGLLELEEKLKEQEEALDRNWRKLGGIDERVRGLYIPSPQDLKPLYTLIQNLVQEQKSIESRVGSEAQKRLAIDRELTHVWDMLIAHHDVLSSPNIGPRVCSRGTTKRGGRKARTATITNSDGPH